MDIKYGTMTKTIDITEHFTNLFIKNNNILIPKNTNFNECFGDPLPNNVKNIYVIKDGYHHLIIGENDPSYHDIHFSLEIDDTFDQSDLVSIIIPTYNRFTYLLNTIKSIKSQTYKNMEIIVVNDGSSQLEYYSYNWKQNNIKIINLPENSKDKFGYACAGGYQRNFGIDITNGKYIAFCDDDDIWFPNKIKLQIDAMRKSNCKMSSTEGLIGTGMYNNRLLYKKYNSEYYYNNLLTIYQQNNSNLLDSGIPNIWNLDFLKIHNCAICSSVILDKEIIDKIGYFAIKNKEEDYDYWLRVLQHTDSVYVKDICFYYDNGHGDGQLY